MKTNMEYCKYQNTLKALKELNEILEWDTDAMFNLSDEEREMQFDLKEMEGEKKFSQIREVWSGEEMQVSEGKISIKIPAHGTKLFGLL